MNVGILVFPGSNCDQDCKEALVHRGLKPILIPHDQRQWPQLDAVIIPGGFSYGDYLRAGALAARSAGIDTLKAFVDKGGYALGICNGFQILTEASLLKGSLVENSSGRFICKRVTLHIPLESCLKPLITKPTLNLPIAHGQGRYIASAQEIQLMRDKHQVLLEYADDVNGSIQRIAGITNDNRRVWGMMPHPERADEKILGGYGDGQILWDAFFTHIKHEDKRGLR